MGGVIYTLIGLVTDITSSHVMLTLSLSHESLACVVVIVKWLLYPSRKYDSVSRDQFSQDQLPPDQLSQDQLATRSTQFLTLE